MIFNKPKHCSKPERYFENLLDYLFPNVNIYRNYRPNWLKNERTGHNLELDFYIAKPIMIGIEYQGYQHFKETNYKNLDYQQYKDNLKQILARKNKNIDIMELFEDEYQEMKKMEIKEAGNYLLKLARKRLRKRYLSNFKKEYTKQKRKEYKESLFLESYLHECDMNFYYNIS